jgi:exodeoxyribonuclease VII small subunit
MKSFEERLSRLETIAERIRESDVPIEEAATLFEEGVMLAKGLDRDLERIERKIEQLVNQPTEPEEKPVLELFPELNDVSNGGGVND